MSPAFFLSDGLVPDFNVTPNLNYGTFDFSLTSFSLKSTGVSFAATASDTTPWQAFGRKYSGDVFKPDGGPGHPYARFAWNVSAQFDGSTINASSSGYLEVEYEKLTGSFATKTFWVGSKNIGTDGKITITISESFSDALENLINSFCFQLPAGSKCPQPSCLSTKSLESLTEQFGTVNGGKANNQRVSEREPAGSLTDKANVIDGGLPSLSLSFGGCDSGALPQRGKRTAAHG